MERKVKIRLTSYLERFGKPGDIIEVNSTFANNFILSKKIGVVVSDAEIQQIADREKKKAALAGKAIEDRSVIREKLHGKKIIFELAGKNNTAFGGISQEDIVHKIAQNFSVKLEKSQVRIPDGHHLKTAGKHEFFIHLHADTFIRMEAEILLK